MRANQVAEPTWLILFKINEIQSHALLASHMNQQRPLQESDIIFSSASDGLKTALAELKRSNLSITNRLKSIKVDAEFVHDVAEIYDLPLIANERCGSWYIDPVEKAGSAYFKSTDGHFGQWSFSLRRLNLHIIDIIGNRGGCVIVDSTRRGKSMPDALSKAVPIWICVLNRLLFPEITMCHQLRTPENIVSGSENAQIEERIPHFVEDAGRLGLDLATLRNKLNNRPIMPEWVTPSDEIRANETVATGLFHRVVLCTASNCDSGTYQNRDFRDGYVQGAADDSESWACGLAPNTFWAHRRTLLDTSEDDLPTLIEHLMIDSRGRESVVREPVLVKPTSNIHIANNAAAEQFWNNFHIIMSCSPLPIASSAQAPPNRYIHLKCAEGKNGSRELRKELMKLSGLQTTIEPTTRVLVTDPSGRDLAVGVALAMICLLHKREAALDKAVIKQRLSWIMVSMPDAAPSRATLQSVNAFLLDSRRTA